MFDPLNKISVDAIISPKSEGERELAAFHFLNLLPEDLVRLDRGYPPYWLLNLITSISDLLEIIIVTTEPVRPGRKYPRNFNKREGRFQNCYKSVR